MRHKTILVLMLIGLLVVPLAACGNGDDENSGELPEPRSLLTEAAQNFDSASAFQMQLRQSGDPTLITEALGYAITFDRAEAVFVAPNRLSALVNVVIDALTQEVELVIIGQDQYARNRFLTTGQWQEFTFARGFDGSDLQSDNKGIGAALRDIKNAEVVGRDEIEGIDVYHVTGQVEANKLRSVTVGLIGTNQGAIAVDIYLRTRDSFPARIVIVEPPKDGEGEEGETVWTVDFSGYNRDDLSVIAPENPAPEAITPPENEDDETNTTPENSEG